MKDKILDLVDKGKEYVSHGIEFISDKIPNNMKKKTMNSNQVEQLGKKLTLEEMGSEYYDPPKEDRSESIISSLFNKKDKTIDEKETPTKKDGGGLLKRKKKTTSSYVGSAVYPETTPPLETTEIVLEDKPTIADGVAGFVKDVTTPNRTGDSMRQRKRKLIVKKIFRLFKWAIVILVIIVLRNKYIAYSGNVKQKITYNEFPYVYVFDRNNYDVNVTKYLKSNCDDEKQKCDVQTVGSYNIKFSDLQMFAVRTLFDIKLRFNGGEKELTYKDLNNELYERVVRALMMNDSKFLDTDRFTDYTVVDYSQKSVYKERGFYTDADNENGKTRITIALGKQEYDGYSVKINEVHETNGNYVVYVLVEEPVTTEWKGDNAPIVVFEINANPDKVRVIDIKNGADFDYKGSVSKDSEGNITIIDKIDDPNNGKVNDTKTKKSTTKNNSSSTSNSTTDTSSTTDTNSSSSNTTNNTTTSNGDGSFSDLMLNG